MRIQFHTAGAALPARVIVMLADVDLTEDGKIIRRRNWLQRVCQTVAGLNNRGNILGVQHGQLSVAMANKQIGHFLVLVQKLTARNLDFRPSNRSRVAAFADVTAKQLIDRAWQTAGDKTGTASRTDIPGIHGVGRRAIAVLRHTGTSNRNHRPPGPPVANAKWGQARPSIRLPVDGPQSMARNRWPAIDGPQSMARNRWPAIDGPQSMARNRWPAIDGPQSASSQSPSAAARNWIRARSVTPVLGAPRRDCLVSGDGGRAAALALWFSPLEPGPIQQRPVKQVFQLFILGR